MMSLINLNSIAEVAALFAGLLFYKNFKSTSLKWAVPFLCFIIAVEGAGWYMRHQLKQPNGVIYNFSIPLEYCFYSWFIAKQIRFTHLSSLLKSTMALFGLMCLYLYISGGIDQFHTPILVAGNCLMILYCCFYFWQLFQIESNELLHKVPIFWIIAGVFLFNMGELSYSLFSRIMFGQLDKYATFFRTLMDVLNLVLYGCFIRAFTLKTTTAV